MHKKNFFKSIKNKKFSEP